MNHPPVAAIIVHYGAAGTGAEERCRACLDSLRASAGVDCLAIVVDNNPAPSATLRKAVEQSRGRYLVRSDNPGFAAGANAGIRAARAGGDPASIAVLNPDVRLAADCLGLLNECLARQPDVGLAGPGLLCEASPDVWWNAGSEIVWPSGKPRSLLHGRGRTEAGGADLGPPRDVGFVCGSLLAFRPEVVERAGYLPEHYFLYFEDADFSYRVRAAGLRTVVVPGALAWHQGGGSSAGMASSLEYYRVRNRLRFSRQWNPYPIRGRIHRGAFALRVLLRAAARGAAGREPGARASLRAILDYIRGTAGQWSGA